MAPISDVPSRVEFIASRRSTNAGRTATDGVRSWIVNSRGGSVRRSRGIHDSRPDPNAL